MKPRLVRVEKPAAEFAPLFSAARAAGIRLGWLDLAARAEVAPDLEAAAAAGALRAVAVGQGLSVAVKCLRGEAVLTDLVREHFTGCRLLLVRGAIDAPLLEPSGEDWRLRDGSKEAVAMGAEAFLAALRRPRFP